MAYSNTFIYDFEVDFVKNLIQLKCNCVWTAFGDEGWNFSWLSVILSSLHVCSDFVLPKDGSFNFIRHQNICGVKKPFRPRKILHCVSIDCILNAKSSWHDFRSFKGCGCPQKLHELSLQCLYCIIVGKLYNSGCENYQLKLWVEGATTESGPSTRSVVYYCSCTKTAAR